MVYLEELSKNSWVRIHSVRLAVRDKTGSSSDIDHLTCRDSNHGFQVSDTTSLPTAPQPLPKIETKLGLKNWSGIEFSDGDVRCKKFEMVPCWLSHPWLCHCVQATMTTPVEAIVKSLRVS